MSQATYRLARGTIKLPRDNKSGRTFTTSGDFIKQGEMIPEGVLSDEQIKSFLATGRIELMAPAEVKQAAGMPKTRGKWGVDPTALIGKSMEELLVMVLEIDPEFDVTVIETEVDAVRQLTSDWDPAFREEIARSTDRSRPEQMKLKVSHDGNEVRGARDAGSRPMSPGAERALENAKQRAQAKLDPSTTTLEQIDLTKTPS